MATLSTDGAECLLSHGRRRSRLTVSMAAALFWVLWYGGVVLHALSQGASLSRYWLMALAASCGIALLMWIAIARWAERSETRPFGLQILITCIGSVAAALVHGGLHMLLLGGGAGAPVALWLLLYLIWGASITIGSHVHALADRERRMADLRVAQLQARVEALRQRVNPHFLFNTLNSVSALVLERRIDEADRALGQLADFFRMSLDDQPLGTVSLADEFAAQRRYLAIERLRFGSRILDAFDLPEELAQVKILPFLIQPLVENAVRHGLVPGRGIRIGVSASRCRDRLEIVVADDGGGSVGGTGKSGGLANIGKRLRMRYGEAASLAAAPLRQGGFSATITLPFETGSGRDARLRSR